VRRGSYFGTTVGGTWWHRYKEPPFFARGNGEFWLDDDGIGFVKTLTKHPITIAWGEITGVSLGRGHAGQWGAGRPVLKVRFNRDARDLEAGFLLSSDWPQMEVLASDLQRRAGG